MPEVEQLAFDGSGVPCEDAVPRPLTKAHREVLSYARRVGVISPGVAGTILHAHTGSCPSGGSIFGREPFPVHLSADEVCCKSAKRSGSMVLGYLHRRGLMCEGDDGLWEPI